MVRSWAVGPSLSLLGLQCSPVTSAPHDGGGGRAPGGGGGGPGPPRASPPLPAPPTARLLAAQQQAATAPTPGLAGVSREELGTWILNLSIASSPSRWVQKRSNPAMLPEDTASPTFTRRCCSAQARVRRLPEVRTTRATHITTDIPGKVGATVPT
ncbi:uncharacterized protein LOC117062490 isoform X2 [Trachypithecus francoisi]|uniref:uncharacterized protein LOC117062490 isoform X2 n=1 Tax=Trachypithecus francoisi TaxID=54180 RepID=UPI00141A869F|nr:uncharacterized protein LOC117062490 isoform X2 [Trachypithecus francoisi]